MYDFEIELFDELAQKLLAYNKDLYLSSDFVRVPASFPAVMFYEIDNATNIAYQDSSTDEIISNLSFTLEIYTKNTPEGREEAANLFNISNKFLIAKNFTRTTATRLINAADTSIFRFVARYRVSIDSEGLLYRS